jgi:hypothetical protein
MTQYLQTLRLVQCGSRSTLCLLEHGVSADLHTMYVLNCAVHILAEHLCSTYTLKAIPYVIFGPQYHCPA